jgi:hypothetical protein
MQSTYELGIAWAETMEATTPAMRAIEYCILRECEVGSGG